jgi:uncharacterized protein YdhG (YjbR/CyaY superfamily)
MPSLQTHKTVDNYIGAQPEDIAVRLTQIRAIIQKASPDAVESIAYGMPAYKTYAKPLVYFAAFANHIGFYATPTGHEVFAKDLSAYKQWKGSVQFPHNQKLPVVLIKKIVQYRAQENKKSFWK